MNTFNLKHLLLSILLIPVLTACGSSNDPKEDQPVIDPELNVVFFDDFATFNTENWSKETHEAGWTNRELQSYAPAQVTVGKDGDKTVLILTARRNGDKIVSGRINSKGKKAFGYGTVSASIKLPRTANGLWPAFWMMGNNDKEWPACGEIDIMEMGDSQGIADGTSRYRVNTALHYGPDVAAHEQMYYAANAAVDLQDGKYHTYTMRREENKIDVFIDDVPFHSFDIAGNQYFKDDFFILFNLAVGGAFTNIFDAEGITALKDGQSVQMFVDWVKVTK